MSKKLGLPLIATALLIGVLVHALGQTTATRQSPWLESYTPTLLEWFVLQKQADEGDQEFGENGVTVHFYLAPDSLRTGEILCDLAYLPATKAHLVQQIEDGILERFEVDRRAYPWARVKIIKKVVELN